MRAYEWLTLAGVVMSPIVAVLITLWIDGRRRDRDGKLHVVRLLMATRHLPSDPGYSTAINLLRVEFAKSLAVMEAYRDYMRLIRVERASTPQGIEAQWIELKRAQTKLLSSALRAVGLGGSEADLGADAYAADGFLERDNLYLDSLRAQLRTAEALEAMTKAQSGPMPNSSDHSSS